VIKVGGLAVDDPAQAEPLLRALAALHHDEPGGVVLVHGGGKAVDRRLERLGLPTVRAAGLRVTPPDQIDEVVATLAGVVNKRLTAALNYLGARAVGMCLGDGAMTTANPLVMPGVELGLVGRITGGDPSVLRHLLDERYMPVLSSIAFGPGGVLLNVNADDAAAALASMLGARMLVLLTDVNGVLADDGRRIPFLESDEIERLIGDGVIHGGMIPKVRAALAAANHAGAPVLIASWSDPDAIAHIAKGHAPGTLIVPDEENCPSQADSQGAAP
jgi:acetylglutamate kinase